MSLLLYCVNLLLPMTMRATSLPHKIESSMAFFSSPFFRLLKVACKIGRGGSSINVLEGVEGG